MFYPLFIVIFELVERLWIHVVEDQNHKTVFAEAKTAVMTRDKELVDTVAALSKMKTE